MVIGNQGENFSVGANLMMVLLAAQEEEWDELNAAIHRYQQINMALKYAPKPHRGRAGTPLTRRIEQSISEK